MQTHRSCAAMGGGLLLLGLTVLAGWLFHFPALVRVLPGADGIPYSTAIGFVLIGLPIALFPRGRTALPVTMGTLLVALGVGALIEWQIGWHVGLSPEANAVREWFADADPHIGRMRPLAAAAFIAMGVVWLLLALRRAVWASVSAQALALLVIFIGGVGILGQLTHLAARFGWYVGPVFTSGISFVLSGVGLLLITRRAAGLRDLEADDSGRIGLLAGAIVVMTGFLGILGGFAVLFPQTVGALQGSLALSLKNRSATLENAVHQGWRDSYAFANQPLRRAVMERVNHDPGDQTLREAIQSVAAHHAEFGFTGVVFQDASGREVARAGSFVTDPELRLPVATPAPGELLWKDGYLLRVQTEMIDGGRVVGHLLTERRLALPGALYATDGFGASLDFAVCGLVNEKLDCFPLNSTAGRVLRQAPAQFAGQPLPMAYALAGKTGIVEATDYRGVEVIAAHMPVGALGLGAVLKINATELYQPIGQRLWLLFAALLLLAATAVVLLRIQVLPLVRNMGREIEERRRTEARLQESEARLAEITATLGEGVFVLDERGTVTFANPEVERLLGWSAAEVIGQDLHETFHGARPDGRVIGSGECPIRRAASAGEPFRTLSDWFVRRDGSFLPVSIIGRPIVRDGAVKGSVLSFQDISERRRIEEVQLRLGASLRRLNEIAAFSHLPLTEQFRRALAVGAEHFGLELGIVSHIHGESYEVVAQVSPPGTLSDGQVFQFSRTYCSITLTEGAVVAISQMSGSRYLGHPCYREFGLEAYIGAPIRAGDELFGTVNFSSRHPFKREFDEGDREFLALLARWAGSAIERHRATEAIRQDQRRVRALLDATSESVLLLATDGQIRAINACGAERFGTPPDALIGRNFFDLVPPEVAAGRREAIARATATGEPLYHQDQRQGIFFETGLYPVRGEQGEIESVAVYAKDVTAAKRAARVEAIFHHLDTVMLKWRTDLEAIAQMFCDELAPLFELTAVWIGRAERDGRLTILSGAGAEFVGSLKNAGMVWMEDRPNCCQPVAEVLRSGHGRRFAVDNPECRDCRAGAEPVGAGAVMILPLNLRGAAWGVLTVYGRDSAHLEGVQHGLDAIANRLGSVLESALQQEWLTLFDSALAGVSNAVMITDARGKILWANQSLATITGYAGDEIVGNTPALFRSGVHDAEFYREFWEALLAGTPWRGEFVNAQPDGRRYTVSQTVTPLFNLSGQISHYVAVVEDISERKAMEEHIRHAAQFDLLTDLPNRGLFFDRLGHALARARRDGHPLALLFLDLDRFKEVNDTLGHEAGDLLLKQVAERLRRQVRESDTVARLAGDEFMVILPQVGRVEAAISVAEKIIAAIEQPFDLKGRQACIGVSIGVALFPEHGDNGEQVLNAADRAMYQAKQAGRNVVRVFGR